jgi:hypothetical protein
MSDKVELIATAQVNAFAGPPAGIAFKSNFGFKTATRGGPGVYELTLDDKHDAHKFVVQVTANSTVINEIQASLLGTGDINGIQVTNFDAEGAPADVPFFITVWRVRS